MTRAIVVARPLAVMLASLAILLLAFTPEAAAAVRVWIASTAYNHGFLVLPLTGWLIWDRRHHLAATPIAPWPAAAIAVLPLAAAWFAAKQLGVMEGRQFAALGLAELLAAVILGRQMTRALAAPLLFLTFLVPSGAFLTPQLQIITAGCIDLGLTLLRIPHLSDALFIEIPEGRFVVAEACAGLRFLVASVAFGTLYGFMLYRDLIRRVAFIAACLVVPILANGLRALGIVVLGHALGSAQAAAADHLIYGWGFFAVVTLGLVAAGLPFRQADQSTTETENRTAGMDKIVARHPTARALPRGSACHSARSRPPF
jgi:exosortase A